MVEVWILKTIVEREYYVHGEGWQKDPSDHITAHATKEEAVAAMKGWRNRKELLSPDEVDASPMEEEDTYLEKEHYVVYTTADYDDCPSDGAVVRISIRQKIYGFKQCIRDF